MSATSPATLPKVLSPIPTVPIPEPFLNGVYRGGSRAPTRCVQTKQWRQCAAALAGYTRPLLQRHPDLLPHFLPEVLELQVAPLGATRKWLAE
jgi:hypothetical protein